MGKIKILDLIVKNGDYPGFKEAYTEAIKNKKDVFTFEKTIYPIAHGKAACDIIEGVLNLKKPSDQNLKK